MADETQVPTGGGSAPPKPARPRARKARRTQASRRRRAAGRALAQLEAGVPPSLRAFSRRMREGLARLEKTIEKEGRAARRRATRLLREASHRLGRLEARGEREWRSQSRRARQAAVRVLQQLEKAIEPPSGVRRRRKPAGPGSGNAP